MQVSLGRIFAFEKQPNALGSTPDAEFKVRLPDPYTLYFIYIYVWGVVGIVVESRRL
jgi:hypothetical protein